MTGRAPSTRQQPHLLCARERACHMYGTPEHEVQALRHNPEQHELPRIDRPMQSGGAVEQWRLHRTRCRVGGGFTDGRGDTPRVHACRKCVRQGAGAGRSANSSVDADWQHVRDAACGVAVVSARFIVLRSCPCSRIPCRDGIHPARWPCVGCRSCVAGCGIGRYNTTC